MKTQPRNRPAMTLAVTMIMALLLATIGASFLTLTNTVTRSNEANFIQHALINVAERGADQAMVALGNYANPGTAGAGGIFTGSWPSGGTANWVPKTATSTPAGAVGFSANFNDALFPLGDGRNAKLKVTVQRVPTNMSDATSFRPYIVSEATYQGDVVTGASKYSRQVIMFLAPNPAESRGLIAQRNLTLSGNNVLAIGYDSALGAMNYNAGTQSGTNFNDLVTVATAGTVDGNLSGGNANVFGKVLIGAATDPTQFGPNAHVWSRADVINNTQYKNGGVNPDLTAGGFTALFPVPVAPAAPTNLVVTGDAQTVTSGAYTVSSISLSGNASKKLTINGDVTLVMSGPISIIGQASLVIAPGASLKIYTAHDVSITGGGAVNTSQAAPETGLGVENLRIYGTNPTPLGQTITVAGNGAFTGIIDAPNASLQLGGGGSSGIIFGSIKAYDIKANGSILFHYDSNTNINTFKSFALDYWIETGATKLNMANFF